jgi:hypothetical protein
MPAQLDDGRRIFASAAAMRMQPSGISRQGERIMIVVQASV